MDRKLIIFMIYSLKLVNFVAGVIITVNNTAPLSSDFRVKNSCPYVLWVEAHAGAQGQPLNLSVPIHKVDVGGYVDFAIPDGGLAGARFWAKYNCNATGMECEMGDQVQYWRDKGCPKNGCTPPIDSLFEATFGCKEGLPIEQCALNPSNGQPLTRITNFDTSQVDGYTIPYLLTLYGNRSQCDCNGTVCGLAKLDGTNLDLTNCPANEDLTANNTYSYAYDTRFNLNHTLRGVDLRYHSLDNTKILGCISPCKKLNFLWGQDESTKPTLLYCCPTPAVPNCTESAGCMTSEECRHGPVIYTDWVKAIHQMAPGIYSYSYDDGVGLHTCPAKSVQYQMEFCPTGSKPYPHSLSTTSGLTTVSSVSTTMNGGQGSVTTSNNASGSTDGNVNGEDSGVAMISASFMYLICMIVLL